MKVRGIGFLLRSLRKQANLTVEQLAHRVGCSKSLISKYENMAAPIDLEMLDKISVALNYDPEAVTLIGLMFHYPRLKRKPFRQQLEAILASLQTHKNSNDVSTNRIAIESIKQEPNDS